jgi:hypothetical protein
MSNTHFKNNCFSGGKKTMKKRFLILLSLCFVFTGASSLFAAFTSQSTTTFIATVDFTAPASGSMDASLWLINGAGLGASTTTITWDNTAISSATIWKVAQAVIVVTNTYNMRGWGIRIYTDNTGSDGTYRWNNAEKSVSSNNCAGLLGVDLIGGTTSTIALPMCWRITDKTTNTYNITQDTNAYISLYDPALDGPSGHFYSFSYMKDITTPDDPNTVGINEGFNAPGSANGDPDAPVVWREGYGIHNGPGTQWAGGTDNPNYIYIGARFSGAATQRRYVTDKLRLELYYE